MSWQYAMRYCGLLVPLLSLIVRNVDQDVDEPGAGIISGQCQAFHPSLLFTHPQDSLPSCVDVFQFHLSMNSCMFAAEFSYQPRTGNTPGRFDSRVYSPDV